jgi:hypothetical protein
MRGSRMIEPTMCLECGEPETVTSHADYRSTWRPYSITRYQCEACGHRREVIAYLTAQGSAS